MICNIDNDLFDNSVVFKKYNAIVFIIKSDETNENLLFFDNFIGEYISLFHRIRGMRGVYIKIDRFGESYCNYLYNLGMYDSNLYLNINECIKIGSFKTLLKYGNKPVPNYLPKKLIFL